MQNVSKRMRGFRLRWPSIIPLVFAVFVTGFAVLPSRAQVVEVPDTADFVAQKNRASALPEYVHRMGLSQFDIPNAHLLCFFLLALASALLIKDARRYFLRPSPLTRMRPEGTDNILKLSGAEQRPPKSRSVNAPVTNVSGALPQDLSRVMRSFSAPMIDALTGLPNRCAMKHRVEEAIVRAKQNETTVALAILDLDRFRDFNAVFGDEAGDKVLARLAEVFRSIANVDTTIGRIGGDEFAFLFEGNSEPLRLKHLANRVLASLDNDVVVGGVNYRLSASIGVSQFPKDGLTHRDLMQSAGVALCHAKSKGRGQASHYFDEMEQRSEDSLWLEYELRCGIEQGELLMFYQPQVDMNTGAYVGGEALLRWQHPQKGLLLPGGFVPLALDTGLTSAIDDFVLEQVFRQLADWRRQGFKPAKISVNLSAATLLTSDFSLRLKALASAHGVELSRLEIELLESSVFPHVRATCDVLQELRDLGVGLAIDDFGTGFSSLAMLRELPLDRIKIDRSFVANMLKNTRDDRIVSGLLSLARSLDIRVVAEGVEDESQCSRLMALGCSEAQGYLFGHPMSAQDFKRAWNGGSELSIDDAAGLASVAFEPAQQ